MIKTAELVKLFWSLVGPWQFMSSTLPYLCKTVQRLFRINGYRGLLSWNRVQDSWFSSFWAWMGPQLRQNRGPVIAALLEGRVKDALVVHDPAAPPVSGVVLDIGPGLGYWVDLYAKAELPIQKNGVRTRGDEIGIQKVFGVEPNSEAHAGLAQRAQDAGLDGVYEILPVGIQSISQANTNTARSNTNVIEKGSVDCIVSILCLCSIPEPEKNIEELYSYLKKGGRWYLYEHVQVQGSWFMRLYQGMKSEILP